MQFREIFNKKKYKKKINLYIIIINKFFLLVIWIIIEIKSKY